MESDNLPLLDTLYNTAPTLEAKTRKNMDKLQCIQTLMGQEYLPCEKQLRKQPFQAEKRWLSIDLKAVFPYLWLSRKHS